MKYLVVAVAVIFLGGCAITEGRFYPYSIEHFKPKSDISKVLVTEGDIDTPYNVVGKVRASGNPLANFAEVINALRKKTAEIGADAVVRTKRDVSRNPAGFVVPVAEGVAVVFKGRTNLLEEDLRVGLSMDAVRMILGPPYYKSSLVLYQREAKLYHYLSLKSARSYDIIFVRGRVTRIAWFDISSQLERAKKKLPPAEAGFTRPSAGGIW